MLPREDRLHRPADFTEVVRRGRRSSRPLLTVHALLADDDAAGHARAGLVVSRAIGGSVVRSTVSRRLPNLPSGSRIVVRAGTPAGSASSAALAADLDAALPGALRPRGSSSPRTPLAPGSGRQPTTP